MDLVTRHWSGKHHRVVDGINLISLVWTEDDARFPCDFRIYDKVRDQLDKNDHFQHMVFTAYERGFSPRRVAIDSWYASLRNLKQLRACDWAWLTQLKANRLVDPDGAGNRPLRQICWPLTGGMVHLKGYGVIRVFKMATPHGGVEYWATSNLACTLEQLADDVAQVWHIEDANAHRALKQFCGVEQAQHRQAVAQRNHIGFALPAFLRLECHRLTTGVSWFEAKTSLVREAIRAYLAQPRYTQLATA